MNQHEKRKICFLFLLFSLVSCSGQDCGMLPNSFQSHAEAKKQVRKSNFKTEEKLDTSNSPWIRSVEFYSCDRQTGFVILTISKSGKDYIYKGAPISLWNEWKNASSKGNFYNKYVKGRYILEL